MSLAKKLQREMKAHPAKAGGLALLLLLAGYFWAPLVKGWIGSADATTPPPTPPAVATAPSGVVMASPAATSATPGAKPAGADPAYDWRKYAKLINEDDHMRTGVERPNDRDPFARLDVAIETAESAPPDEATLAAAKPITPEEAGLTLGSTLVSTRKKIAQIGGKSYTIGSRVSAAQDGLAATFEVVSIEPRRVVLKRNGQRFELKIPRPLMDGIVEIVPDEPSDRDPTQRAGTQTIEQRTSDGQREQSEAAADDVVN